MQRSADGRQAYPSFAAALLARRRIDFAAGRHRLGHLGKSRALACGTSTFSRLCGRLFHSNLSSRNPQTIFSVSSHNGISEISSGCGAIFLVGATHDDLQAFVRQRPLERPRLIPQRAHTHVAFFVGGQDHRHGLGMDRLGDGVRRGGKKPLNQMRSGIGFDLVPRAPLNSVQIPAKANRGQSSFNANRTTSHASCRSPGSAPARIRRSCSPEQGSGFLASASRARVLRILVTGNPPARGGGGMLERIIVNSRPASAFLMTNRETRRSSAAGCRHTG